MSIALSCGLALLALAAIAAGVAVGYAFGRDAALESEAIESFEAGTRFGKSKGCREAFDAGHARGFKDALARGRIALFDLEPTQINDR